MIKKLWENIRDYKNVKKRKYIFLTSKLTKVKYFKIFKVL